MKNMRIALPLLWVFMVLNYAYCDIVSEFDPAVLANALQGHAAGGTFAITPGFLFAASLLMEIPMAMVVLSRVLPQAINRWANVAAASFMALVQLGSLTVGSPAAYYVFFSLIEISTLVSIAVLAVRWKDARRTEAALETI